MVLTIIEFLSNKSNPACFVFRVDPVSAVALTLVQNTAGYV